jgi:hypothetical protein
VEPQRDRNEPPTSVWGNPSVPDPREDIPGWREQSLGGQVAGNAAGRLA